MSTVKRVLLLSSQRFPTLLIKRASGSKQTRQTFLLNRFDCVSLKATKRLQSQLNLFDNTLAELTTKPLINRYPSSLANFQIWIF
ncbi:hypothetical protein EYC80_004373 [Monilinia laxa]|uniref:Uncharacterized protein n=1 Tax=Monilinia laxa TaxID=61186 RepID=A0A5N6KN19_MONLA|nr:hypothetical protein EYC80_004373 [Monilinia laxa]